MTTLPLDPPSPRQVINWTAVSAIVVLLIQFAGVVTFGARASAEITELKATTQPLRDGALVKIETDVAWIRAEMEEEKRR